MPFLEHPGIASLGNFTVSSQVSQSTLHGKCSGVASCCFFRRGGGCQFFKDTELNFQHKAYFEPFGKIFRGEAKIRGLQPPEGGPYPFLHHCKWKQFVL